MMKKMKMLAGILLAATVLSTVAYAASTNTMTTAGNGQKMINEDCVYDNGMMGTGVHNTRHDSMMDGTGDRHQREGMRTHRM